MSCQRRSKRKPGLKDYQKYELKLRTGFGEKVKEYLDMVLFITTNMEKLKHKTTKDLLKTKVTQSKERYLFTEDCISHFAKNRYNLPPEIQVEKGKVWKTLEQELKKALAGDKKMIEPTGRRLPSYEGYDQILTELKELSKKK